MLPKGSCFAGYPDHGPSCRTCTAPKVNRGDFESSASAVWDCVRGLDFDGIRIGGSMNGKCGGYCDPRPARVDEYMQQSRPYQTV